jgi:hypothetical protein
LACFHGRKNYVVFRLSGRLEFVDRRGNSVIGDEIPLIRKAMNYRISG